MGSSFRLATEAHQTEKPSPSTTKSRVFSVFTRPATRYVHVQICPSDRDDETASIEFFFAFQISKDLCTAVVLAPGSQYSSLPQPMP